jgi:hypothetical protein
MILGVNYEILPGSRIKFFHSIYASTSSNGIDSFYEVMNTFQEWSLENEIGLFAKADLLVFADNAQLSWFLLRWA